MPERSNWYCVTVRPGWMQRVAFVLRAMGYRVLYPEQKQWVRRDEQRVVVWRPLSGLANYLFVAIEELGQSHWQCSQVYGVSDFVRADGEPVRFGWAPIDLLSRQLSGEFDYAGKKPLQVGDRVRVVDGEHDGELAFVTDRKGGRVTYRLKRAPIYKRVSPESLRAA